MSELIRSITDTAGTITLSSGRTFHGWTMEGGDGYVRFLVALLGEEPGSSRVERVERGEFGVRGDAAEVEPTVLLVNIAHLESYEWAGEDGW